MNTIAINDIEELRAEIGRLSLRSDEQGKALAERFHGPLAIFNTARSLFHNGGHPDENAAKGDFFNLIARVLLPLTLNKTIFSGSGFPVKMLVGFVSQKAAGLVNEKLIAKVIEEGKTLFNKLFHKPASEVRGSEEADLIKTQIPDK